MSVFECPDHLLTCAAHILCLQDECVDASGDFLGQDLCAYHSVLVRAYRLTYFIRKSTAHQRICNLDLGTVASLVGDFVSSVPEVPSGILSWGHLCPQTCSFCEEPLPPTMLEATSTATATASTTATSKAGVSTTTTSTSATPTTATSTGTTATVTSTMTTIAAPGELSGFFVLAMPDPTLFCEHEGTVAAVRTALATMIGQPDVAISVLLSARPWNGRRLDGNVDGPLQHRRLQADDSAYTCDAGNCSLGALSSGSSASWSACLVYRTCLIERCENPPPSLTMNFQVCGPPPMFSCKYSLNSLSSMIPESITLEWLCPAACNQCQNDEVGTAESSTTTILSSTATVTATSATATTTATVIATSITSTSTTTTTLLFARVSYTIEAPLEEVEAIVATLEGHSLPGMASVIDSALQDAGLSAYVGVEVKHHEVAAGPHVATSTIVATTGTATTSTGTAIAAATETTTGTGTETLTSSLVPEIVQGTLAMIVSDPTAFARSKEVKTGLREGLAQVVGVAAEFVEVVINVLRRLGEAAARRMSEGHVEVVFTISIPQHQALASNTSAEAISSKLNTTNTSSVEAVLTTVVGRHLQAAGGNASFTVQVRSMSSRTLSTSSVADVGADTEGDAFVEKTDPNATVNTTANTTALEMSGGESIETPDSLSSADDVTTGAASLAIASISLIAMMGCCVVLLVLLRWQRRRRLGQERPSPNTNGDAIQKMGQLGGRSNAPDENNAIEVETVEEVDPEKTSLAPALLKGVVGEEEKEKEKKDEAPGSPEEILAARSKAKQTRVKMSL